MRKQLWGSSVLATIAVSALAGCGSSGSGNEPSQHITTAKGSALHQANSCGDLLAQIQADAIAKLDDTVAQYKEYDYYYGTDDGGVVGSPGNSGDGDGDGAESTSGDTGDSTGTSTDSLGEPTGPEPPRGGGEEESPDVDQGSGDGDDKGEDDGPSGHSETNTQVEDVDEADIVKIGDGGERIFLIHGSEFKILKSWPAEKTAAAGAAQVPGNPFELFVHDGKATVFSSVHPDGLPGEDSKPWACYYGGKFTQVSVFDVTGDTPVIEREMIFEGSYVSSRRHEGVVRVVTTGGFEGRDLFYPDIETYDSFGRRKSDERIDADLEKWRDDVAYDIRNTTLEDWLPGRFEKVDGDWVGLGSQCEGYHVPEPGLVEAGITQVISFEPASDTAPSVVAILGGSETVYANNESLYLAHVDYRWDRWRTGTGPRAALHKFALDGASTSYEASGFVQGVPLNQFSLDESEEVFRIATTEDNWQDPPKNRVFTLQSSEGELKVLDRSDALGEIGERIYAVRFIGDRGYVVTFERTDPLYALDLSDPSDIRVLGELHIPGFSEYIHPLGRDHLLTIGQNADENGTVDGVALQIFDVSDATSPQQDAVYKFGGFSYSEAGNNHKAFTFVDDFFEGGDDLLLFPLVTYEPEYKSALEVFRVSEEDGFSHLGSIDHAGLINRDCSDFSEHGVPCHYYYGEEMRRGLQIDEFVYALSQGGITVHDIQKLSAGPVATVEFEQPVYESNAGCYYGGYYGGDTGWSDGDVDAIDPIPDGTTTGSDTDVTMGGASNE